MQALGKAGDLVSDLVGDFRSGKLPPKNARHVNGQKIWLRAAGADSPLGSVKDLAATNICNNTVIL